MNVVVRLLYVSKEDLENLPDLQSKKLLAVRVPAGARLTVPQSQEVICRLFYQTTRV